MTKDKILNMESGRELDYLIATKIMGWRIIPQYGYDDKETSTIHIFKPYKPNHNNMPIVRYKETFCKDDIIFPKYSTDISLAFEIVEKLIQLGWQFTLHIEHLIWVELFGIDKEYTSCQGYDVPEAICKSALLTTVF